MRQHLPFLAGFIIVACLACGVPALALFIEIGLLKKEFPSLSVVLLSLGVAGILLVIGSILVSYRVYDPNQLARSTASSPPLSRPLPEDKVTF